MKMIPPRITGWRANEGLAKITGSRPSGMDRRKRVCPKGLITSGGRTHTNNGWLDSVADERQVRETGQDEAS